MANIQADERLQHIAFIMDGNGRWAEKNGVSRLAGHNAGMLAMKEIVKRADVMGIKYLTVYAFSTENWKRSQEEVSGIMRLLRRYLEEALQDMENYFHNFLHHGFFGSGGGSGGSGGSGGTLNVTSSLTLDASAIKIADSLTKVGIGEENIPLMANKACKGKVINGYKQFTPEDVEKIYRMSL